MAPAVRSERLLDRLNPTIEELTAAVEREARNRPAAQRLMTRPGVGPLTALAFVLIIGTWERFRYGNVLAIWATGAEIEIPFLANDGGAKAYIHGLGEALHYEFKPRGVYVTVVPPPLTDTPVLAKLGFDPRTMPMKPLSVEQCVSEGLNALRKNRSRIVPGRMNRIMNALLPASVKRTFTARMLGKSLRNRSAAVRARVEA